MIEIVLYFALIMPNRIGKLQYAQYKTAEEACFDGKRESDWILQFVLDKKGYRISTLKCVETKALTAIEVKTDDAEFQEMSEEAVKQTDAEFCKNAKEDWQIKAFCHKAP